MRLHEMAPLRRRDMPRFKRNLLENNPYIYN